MKMDLIEGLKFPDDYVIRFFFKEGLDRKKGRVLEFGCSNGNNLSLFYQYGWDITGVDKDRDLIKKAENNFTGYRSEYGLKNTYEFFAEDMVDFAAAPKENGFDVLVLAGSMDYLDGPQIIRLMTFIKENLISKKGSLLFIRVRTPQDYRYGKGHRCGEQTFRLDIKETQEQGCLLTFLTEADLMSILEANFNFEHKRIFHCNFDNLQNGCMVSNSNVIFWGKISPIKR